MKNFFTGLILFFASLVASAQTYTIPTTQGQNVWTNDNYFVFGDFFLGTTDQACPNSPAQQFMTGYHDNMAPICSTPPSGGALTALCNGFVDFTATTVVPHPGSVSITQACSGITAGTGGDNISADFSGNPIGVVGFIPSTSGTLTIYKSPSTGFVTFSLVNNTSADITLTSDIVINYIGIGIR